MSETAEGEPVPEAEGEAEELEATGYEPTHVLISALAGLIVAYGLVSLVARGPFYESIFRVGPTAEGPARGVGADWVAGNTVASLDFLIALTHAADVILGLFVLFLVFVHWAAFRRLAARMRGGTGGGPEEAVATDGGGPEDETVATDGGERP